MHRITRNLVILAAGFAAGFFAVIARGADRPTAPARERLLMDFDWRFHLGNEWGIGQNLAKAGSGIGPASVTFSDASWREVDLPHDWAVELPFDQRGDGAHGFKALGETFPENSVGWYRRKFDLPKTDVGRRIWLDFDGAFRDCTVFVNGWFVGHHESGYSNFRYDVTDVVECGGSNVVAVRVDATHTEGWFYEGAGIYRHVWLLKTAPLAIAPDGVFVYSQFKDNVPVGPATTHLEASLTNAADTATDAEVAWQILAPTGEEIAAARQSVRIEAAATLDVRQTAAIATPQLWSPESPVLYKLVTTVTTAGAVVDQVETTFGIRTVGFDAEKGFILNGQPYVIQGTCNHQDHAGVGVVLPDRLQVFRIERLKEMGSNAYRSAHNPPTPAVLEACDRLGMLVIDESRLLGSDALNLDRLDRLVRRDRNHPSVVIWSLANEEFTTQGTPSGGRVAATMQAFIKRLDPTSPVTYNAPVGNEFAGINEVIEVRGWSYRIGVDRMDAYHAEHPLQPNVGSEQGSTLSTRGIYANDPAHGYMSAYDDNQADWSNTAKQWVGFFAPRPWLSGGFVWTGFDYRGEPTPYDWPNIGTQFGILDTCGFPKDNFYNYQAWWTDSPRLHVMPHWNWAGREGHVIDVRTLSNCEEVELLLNGQSLGRRKMPRFSELAWSVPYAPGTLSARGFNAGRAVIATKVETTGGPSAVQLTPDRAAINADGEDVAIYTVAVTDAQGRVVPVADNKITFELDGPGRIIGVGNGDPSCHEPDVFVAKPTTRTIAVAGWRWHTIADPYTSTIAEAAPGFDDAAWAVADVNATSGPMGPGGRALFRTTFTVSAEVLNAPAVELRFGRINGGGYVFINGTRIAPTGDSRSASVYDVSSLLHPGPNTIAVALANYGAAAGLNEGVSLRLTEKPAPVAWSRSVFNGLAQVIVRSTKEPGIITLTGQAVGLQPHSTKVSAQAALGRRALP